MSQRVRGLLDRLLARRREAVGDGVSDVELLRRFSRSRDEAAFELLVWRHGAMVLGLCRRAVRDEQHAEDAFQAVFLVLARKAGSVRGNVGGWLFKVGRRVASRAAMRRSVTHPVIETAEVARPDPLERQELTALLDAEVARLPARLRAPVVLCYLGGQSTEDAARELGCPRGTVLSRLATARARLAERLTRRGVTLPAALAFGSGAGLSGQAVSAIVAAARPFVLGSGPLTPVHSLAEGAIHSMYRTTLFTALGATVVAAALASGVCLVLAQNGPPQAVAQLDTPAAEAPAAQKEAPPPAKQESKVDPKVAAREAAEKLDKLTVLAIKLQREIKEIELQIGQYEEVSGNSSNTLARLVSRLAEVDRLYHSGLRDSSGLEAELDVLRKRISVPWRSEFIEDVVNNQPTVLRAKARLTESRIRLEKVLANSADPNAPAIQNLKDAVKTDEKTLDEVRKEAIAAFTQDRQLTTRKQIEDLEKKIAINRAQQDTLDGQRRELQKLVASGVTSEVRVISMHKSLEPQREMLARVQREILLLRATQDGITFTDPIGSETKLDAILRELVGLRKDVQELKQKK